MRYSCWYTISLVVSLIVINTFITHCNARGGRGRGGGTFGGIFGGWRKYKKPTSNSNSRRTTLNGSPYHTSLTKSTSNGNSGSAFSNTKQTKPQGSYPEQKMPVGGGAGYTNYGSYYGSGGAGAHLPTGSTYHPNMATIPQGAIYYAQPPQRSGMGDFLIGMMAGHMASNMLFGHGHHVTHVYQQNPNENAQNSPKVIVVNNGEATILNSTDKTQLTIGQHYWPTDMDTPLEPFNTSITSEHAMKPGNEPIFQRVKFNNFQPTQMTQAAQQPQQQQDHLQTSTPPSPRFNGIICMPILLNETDSSDPSKTLQVERTICFPAPPPPSEALTESANTNCVTRTFIETDPNDPSQTIEVPKEICATSTSTLEPPQVAGEIGETVASETVRPITLEAKSIANEETEDYDISAEAVTEGKFIRSITTKRAV